MNKFKSLWSDSFSKKIIILFSTLTLFLIASLFFQKKKMQKQMDFQIQFIEKKNMLRDELDDLIDQHDELLDEYGSLNNQLESKDSIIQNKIAEIRNLIRNKDDLREARRKIDLLKEIAKKYISNIDSLLSLNESLIIEKDSVIKQNKNINWKNYKLSKQNQKLSEKVSKGSALDIFNINAEGIKYRSTGKEVVTRFAKKLQKIKICFTVGANQISDAEEKTVYVQLINSNGEVIKGEKDIQLNILDSIFNCTTSSTFNYQNNKMQNCIQWQRINPLQSDSYLIKLIIEEKIYAIMQPFKLR